MFGIKLTPVADAKIRAEKMRRKLIRKEFEKSLKTIRNKIEEKIEKGRFDYYFYTDHPVYTCNIQNIIGYLTAAGYTAKYELQSHIRISWSEENMEE